MAIGEKLPVVMAKDKAVANGVATLDENKILDKDQWPPMISGQNLLINTDFRAPVNRNGKTEYIEGRTI